MFSKQQLFKMIGKVSLCTILCISFCIFFPSFLFSQVDKSNYALLWEVSGNDLPEKSWLFGSMHVKDVRAFEFPDSLIYATQEAKAFAMEVDPTEMISFIMQMFTNMDTTNVLREMLSPEAYESLNKLVIEKEGKPIDSLENKDPFWIEMMLSDFDEPEYTEKRQQVLDFYFYKLFAVSKKNLFGLEEMKDYQNLTRSFYQIFEKGNFVEEDFKQEEDKTQFEGMMQLYQRGDIEKLNEMVNESMQDEDYEFEMLGRRNQKMCTSFLEIAKKQSLFGVVGAAHLPGGEGMIEILRKKGYQVRKVGATFTGVAEEFVMPENERKWIKTTSEKSFFQVETPVEFEAFAIANVPESTNIEMRFGMDMLEMNIYFSMSMSYPSVNLEGDGYEFYENFIKNWGEDGDLKIIRASPVHTTGFDGYYFETKNKDGQYQWWQIYLRNNVLNMFNVWREDEGMDLSEIERFLESIVLLSPPLPTPNEMQIFTSESGAFSILMPEEPNYRQLEKTQQREGWAKALPIYLHIFQASKKDRTANYIARYHDMPIRKVILDPKAELESNLKSLISSWGEPTSQPKSILVENYPAIQGTYEVNGNEIVARLILREGRQYMLLIQLGSNYQSREDIDNYFNSFKFLPFQQTSLQSSSLGNLGIGIGFPNTFSVDSTIMTAESYPTLSEISWASMDTLSGITYTFSANEWSPYYEANNPDSTYVIIDNTLRENDGFLFYPDTTFQDNKSWHFISKIKGIEAETEHLLFFYEHYLMEMIVQFGGKADPEIALNYFNSFYSTKNYPKDIFLKDRTAALLEDLQNPNLEIRKKAEKGMNRHEFDVADLPLIYAVLEKEFPWDTISAQNIHEILLKEIERYTSDETTFPFLKILFQKSTNRKELQEDILNTLAGMKTKESFVNFFELAKTFEKGKPSAYPYYALFQNLRDTLELTKEFYPQIIDLQSNPTLEYYAYNLQLNLLQANHITKERGDENQDFLLKKAEWYATKYKLKTKSDTLPTIENYYHLDAIYSLMGELSPHSVINNHLKSVEHIPNVNLQVTIVDALLMHNIEVNRATIDSIFAEPYYWFKYLKNLEFEEKLDEAPKELMNPDQIVKAAIYYDIEGKYNGIDKYELLEIKPFEYKGEELDLYIVKFSIINDDSDFLAICSQPQGGKEIRVYSKVYDYSGTVLTEENEGDILEKILKPWRE